MNIFKLIKNSFTFIVTSEEEQNQRMKHFLQEVDIHGIGLGRTIVGVIFSDESGRNLNLVKPHTMMVEVMLNQDSILDFPNGPHILSISHLKYHSLLSEHTSRFKLVMS